MKDPLSIHLDSDHVILRNVGDDEPEPVTLSGNVLLDLHERTAIKDIVIAFTGKARITYTDMSGSYKTHTLDHDLFYDDHSFLPSFDGPSHPAHTSRGSGPPSRQGSSSALASMGDHPSTGGLSSETGTSSAHPDPHVPHHHDKHSKHHHHHHHAHTFNQGLHTFPFHFTVPGSLPSSLRVNNGSSIIFYQLKVTATKSGGFGMFGGKSTYKKPVSIIRGLLPEAAEFNQTLEIENTWPGKIMYNLTLPHKAFCAGENIPVKLKFTPMAKGVRVTQLVTSIKEHLTLTTKLGQPYNVTRDIFTKKHNFFPRSALAQPPSGITHGSAHPVSAPVSRRGSTTDLAGMANQSLNLDAHPFMSSGSGSSSRGRSGHHTPNDISSSAGVANMAHGSPSYTSNLVTSTGSHGAGAGTGNSSANASRHGSRANSPERVYYGRNTNDPEYVGAVDEEGTEDVDVDAVIEIPIPISASPSHHIEPLLISHKLKWSAYIKNLDGHTSELRCALPIHILSPVLVEEARLASSGTRTLLFGPSGVLVPAAEGIQQVDLPSYNEHVRDRVANVDSASAAPVMHTTGHGGPVVAPSFARSPWASPASSPRHSPNLESNPSGYFPDPDHRSRTINWADSELLTSLSMALPQPEHQASQPHSHQQSSHASSQTSSHHASPSTSRPGSRPGSRPSSRPSSRQASRASSPVRGESTNLSSGDAVHMRGQASPSHASGAESPVYQPQPHRTSSSGFFGKHLPKPFTAMGHHGSGATGEKSSSSSSLSNFFHSHAHHRPSSQRSHTGNSSTSGLDESHRHSSSSANGQALALGRASTQSSLQSDEDHAHAHGLSAALEAHQAKQNRKGKGKAASHGRKGMFSSMHGDDHDHEGEDDDGHVTEHEGDHHHHVPHPVDSPSHDVSPHPEREEDQTGQKYLNQVPSYDVARRGFLGGGAPPLSMSLGLPSYDQSESLSRPATPLRDSFRVPGANSDTVVPTGTSPAGSHGV